MNTPRQAAAAVISPPFLGDYILRYTPVHAVSTERAASLVRDADGKWLTFRPAKGD